MWACSDVMRAVESSSRPRSASHDPRINGSRLLPSVFIILIYYICFSALALLRRIQAYQRRYLPDQKFPPKAFQRLASFWLDHFFLIARFFRIAFRFVPFIARHPDGRQRTRAIISV
jgi:hypothetical protein